MSETHTVVCRYDEAIDYESTPKADQDRYIETRDHACLRYIEGERPALFVVRRLLTSEMREVNAQHIESERNLMAFRKGLMSATDVRFFDGTRGPWLRPSPKPIRDAELDRFSPADVNEVGSYVVAWSNLGKGRPAAWPLPATSALALEAHASLRVAQKKASAASSPHSSATPRAVLAGTSGSSPDGVTPGAATATGSNEASP
jgi:hypothetical protein